MDSERFQRLYETARSAAGVKGDDVSVRSKARRELRQTLDLLSMEAEPHQWAAVEWARKNGYPPFDIVVKQKGTVAHLTHFAVHSKSMPTSRRPPQLAVPGEPIYCPHGHKLDKDSWPAGEHPMITQRCTHREPQMTSVCGACVYALAPGNGFFLLVELTSSEAYELSKPGRTLEEILAFAGLRTWKTPSANRRRGSMHSVSSSPASATA